MENNVSKSSIKALNSLNKYLFKYNKYLIVGTICIIISSFFALLLPILSGFIIKIITDSTYIFSNIPKNFLEKWLLSFNQILKLTFNHFLYLICILIILSTIIRGFFMFLMRQTIIVMSRYVEFEQKKEIFKKYTELDSHFIKPIKLVI